MTESPQAVALPAEPVPAVLDTQVVLDWLWFGDSRAAPVGQAVLDGQLRWIWTARMHDELAHVLPRLRPSASGIDGKHVLTYALTLAQLACAPSAPAVASATAALRCSDPSDQKFIDLALSLPGSWLFSRDRAVLKLARRAATRGCRIVDPARWGAARRAEVSGTPPGT